MTTKMGERGIIPVDTTQTEQLLNKQTKKKKNISQDAEKHGNGEVIAGHHNTRQMGKGEELSMSRFDLDKNATENPSRHVYERLTRADVKF